MRLTSGDNVVTFYEFIERKCLIIVFSSKILVLVISSFDF